MTYLDNNSYLKGVLRGFRLAGCTIDDAYSSLLEITETEKFSKELIGTYFQVWDMEMKEKENEREHDEKNLAFMPEKVKLTITKFLDLQSRIHFGNSSPRIREIVDITPLHIDELEVKVKERKFEIIKNGSPLRKYTRFNEHCIVEQDNKLRVINGEGFIEEVAKYLSQILNWRNLSIGTLRISEAPGDSIARYLFRKIAKSLPTDSLKVESISLGCRMGILLKIMKKCEVGYLKHLQFTQTYGINDKVIKTDQWKHLETLTADALYLIDPNSSIADAFSHFQTCKFRPVQNVTFGEFIKLRENLSKNEKFRQMVIIASLEEADHKKIMANRSLFNSVQFWMNHRLLWFRGPMYSKERDGVPELYQLYKKR